MPFRDLVCRPYTEKNNKPYLIALTHRPEFQGIIWNVEDPEDLARQLWKFVSDKPDCSYHRSLFTLLNNLMEYHQVHKDDIKRVQAIMAEWRKTKTTRRFLQKKQSGEIQSEAQLELRRQRKRYFGKRRLDERREGRNLPLIEYIDFDNIESPTPKRVHQEALKYRGKYLTSLSFIRNLRVLFSRLRYKDSQIINLLQDDENYHYPGWNRTNDMSAILTTGGHQAISAKAGETIEVVQSDQGFAHDSQWREYHGIDAIDFAHFEPFYQVEESLSGQDTVSTQVERDLPSSLQAFDSSWPQFQDSASPSPDWDSLKS